MGTTLLFAPSLHHFRSASVNDGCPNQLAIESKCVTNRHSLTEL